MKGQFAPASLALCRAIGETVADLCLHVDVEHQHHLRILELGCGDGRIGALAAAMAGAGYYIGVDNAMPSYGRCWTAAGEALVHYMHGDATDPHAELRRMVEDAHVCIVSLPLLAMKAAGQNVDMAWRLAQRAQHAVVGFTLEPFWPPAVEMGTWRVRRWVPNLTPACVWAYRHDGALHLGAAGTGLEWANGTTGRPANGEAAGVLRRGATPAA